MLGRFTARRLTEPEPSPPEPEAEPPSLLTELPAISTPEIAPDTASGSNPLLSDKLLDAKVRLHRRLIEEINLPALEKLPEEEMKRQIHGLVSQSPMAERLPLNAQELS